MKIRLTRLTVTKTVRIFSALEHEPSSLRGMSVVIANMRAANEIAPEIPII